MSRSLSTLRSRYRETSTHGANGALHSQHRRSTCCSTVNTAVTAAAFANRRTTTTTNLDEPMLTVPLNSEVKDGQRGLLKN